MVSNSRRMPLRDKMGFAWSIFQARYFKRRKPLLVGWSITDRCQYHCAYCGLCGDGKNDLPTERILAILDVLAQSGCRRIQLTGGEPLLREDIGDVLSACRKHRIFTSISTNGLLVDEKIRDLKMAGQINLSVDGEPEVQDTIRGPGAFHAVKHAAESLQKAGVPFRFVSVISSRNLDQVDFLLGFAANYNTLVTFQPVTLEILGKENGNPFVPAPEDYRGVIDRLILAHGKNAPIGNSLHGLRHMRNWPDPTAILCVGGRIFLRIEADGGVVNCQRRRGPSDASVATGDIKAALASVKQVGCTQCWSAPVVEASFILQGNLASILHLNRTL